MKTLLAIIALAVSTSAFPQAAIRTQTLPTSLPLSTALDVERIAPQLVAFAGGEANFQNLVNGLATGTPVTLTTVLPNGATQVVNFTPAGTMTTLQIAQTLETVRQSLISRGIAAPNPQQIATAIAGGALPTPAGTTQVNGVVPTTATTNATTVGQPSRAVSIQNTFSSAAAGGSNSIRSNMSDSFFPRGISDTPPPTVPAVTPAPVATPAPITTPPATAGLRAR
jgi:hypothetical protein